MNNNGSQENYLEVEELSKKIIDEYDLDKCFFKVWKWFVGYNKLKNKCFGEAPIQITTKFDFVFTNKAPNSNIYSAIDQYIDNCEEYYTKSQLITIVSKTMTIEERTYLTYCLLQGKSETKCAQRIGVSNKGLKSIKNSCIVRLSCAFNLEVMKDETMSNEEETEFVNFKNNKIN